MLYYKIANILKNTLNLQEKQLFIVNRFSYSRISDMRTNQYNIFIEPKDSQKMNATIAKIQHGSVILDGSRAYIDNIYTQWYVQDYTVAVLCYKYSTIADDLPTTIIRKIPACLNSQYSQNIQYNNNFQILNVATNYRQVPEIDNQEDVLIERLELDFQIQYKDETTLREEIVNELIVEEKKVI